MTKELLLRLSDEEYQSLLWLSKKIEKNVSETVRGLIPKFHEPSGEIISTDRTENADQKDAVMTQPDFDRNKLKALLIQLNETNYAVTLYRELEEELLGNELPHLSFPVYQRLSRWVSPNRYTKREQTVKPIVTEISQLLFGKIIDRVN